MITRTLNLAVAIIASSLLISIPTYQYLALKMADEEWFLVYAMALFSALFVAGALLNIFVFFFIVFDRWPSAFFFREDQL